jgi:hypothetical protein
MKAGGTTRRPLVLQTDRGVILFSHHKVTKDTEIPLCPRRKNFVICVVNYTEVQTC